MAKAQYPIDGKLGKDFKITSIMGYRIHPVTKVHKHHNGTDIWAPAEPCWIEAPYAGKVIAIGNNPGGYGNSVTLLHKINGKDYTTLYAHMKDGSIKVKKGQKVEAGAPLGKMGTTGMSTGKHLHWELHKGKTHTWSPTGVGYIEPVKFFKALIAQEKAIASAPLPTPATAPVTQVPLVHDDKAAAVVEAVLVAEKVAVAVAVVKPAAPVKPAPAKARPVLKVGSTHAGDVRYLQKKLGVATGGADGIFGPKTKAAVIAFQKKHGLTADGVVNAATWAKIG